MEENKTYDNEEKLKSYAGTNKFMLIIRLAVVGYILYLSWTLIESYRKGEGLPLAALIISVSAFAIISAIIIYTSLKALIRGEYAGGKADEAYREYVRKKEAGELEEEEVKENLLLSERLQKYNEEDK